MRSEINSSRGHLRIPAVTLFEEIHNNRRWKVFMRGFNNEESLLAAASAFSASVRHFDLRNWDLQKTSFAQFKPMRSKTMWEYESAQCLQTAWAFTWQFSIHSLVFKIVLAFAHDVFFFPKTKVPSAREDGCVLTRYLLSIKKKYLRITKNGSIKMYEYAKHPFPKRRKKKQLVDRTYLRSRCYAKPSHGKWLCCNFFIDWNVMMWSWKCMHKCMNMNSLGWNVRPPLIDRSASASSGVKMIHACCAKTAIIFDQTWAFF